MGGLLEPGLVERTKQTLIECHARNRRATRRRNRKMQEFTEQCQGLGARAQAQLAIAKAEHDKRTRAATNFGRMVGDAIAEINDICTMRHRGSSARHELDRALRAISEHKSAAEEPPSCRNPTITHCGSCYTLGKEPAEQAPTESTDAP